MHAFETRPHHASFAFSHNVALHDTLMFLFTCPVLAKTGQVTANANGP